MDDGLVVEETLREIVRRITPAVLDLFAKEDSGEIALRFQAGKFKQAVRKEVAL